MRASDAIIMLAGMAVILGLFSLFTAKADEPCFQVSDAVASAESAGGELIDLVGIPGKLADQLLFVSVNGTVMMFGAMRGCIVAGPIPLDEVDKGTPA